MTFMVKVVRFDRTAQSFPEEILTSSMLFQCFKFGWGGDDPIYARKAKQCAFANGIVHKNQGLKESPQFALDSPILEWSHTDRTNRDPSEVRLMARLIRATSPPAAVRRREALTVPRRTINSRRRPVRRPRAVAPSAKGAQVDDVGARKQGNGSPRLAEASGC
ncbi:hypothetical protein HPB48_007085 [Haemaphysalis longicornis]|uniref:Uncharacterized protein n=1 Tax=Haemaphysalis longicornis TaxID=44386 RepID=A0A9J6G290_HAELO|nr:hypothetical protein HPB48_007085 [Haemaphysalis longicornis]